MALRSSTGANVPGVFQKTCASSYEQEQRGEGRQKSEGQVKQGQQSSFAEPYEGWLSALLFLFLPHTHTGPCFPQFFQGVINADML